MLQPNPVNDYGTGFMGAYSVALALLHRQRTGEGQHVDSALAYTAMTLQSPFMQLYEGKRWDEHAVRRRWARDRCTVPTRRVTAGFSWAPGPATCRAWPGWMACPRSRH
jgi:crotonobetainyl-CoA:carnitine CoA-transferase CaiB-like acyl-CoA transferase